MKKKVKRAEARERLTNLRLGGELVKALRHFFPSLMERLDAIADPRHQSYIIYTSFQVFDRT